MNLLEIIKTHSHNTIQMHSIIDLFRAQPSNGELVTEA